MSSALGVAPFVVIVLGIEDDRNMFASLLLYSTFILIGLIGFSLLTMGLSTEAFAAIVFTITYVGVTGVGLGLARQSGFRLRFSR